MPGTESIGLNATVQIDDNGAGAASGLAFANIDNIISIVPPAEVLQTVISKRVDMPGGRLIVVPTVFEPGKGSIRQDFTHAGYARMESLRKNKVLAAFKFTIPDDGGNTIVTVSGYVTQNKTDSVEPDKITEFEMMIDFSGQQS
jgi:hypothetical protein